MLIAGRLFNPTEMEEGRNVAIVDETFVRLVLVVEKEERHVTILSPEPP